MIDREMTNMEITEGVQKIIEMLVNKESMTNIKKEIELRLPLEKIRNLVEADSDPYFDTIRNLSLQDVAQDLLTFRNIKVTGMVPDDKTEKKFSKFKKAVHQMYLTICHGDGTEAIMYLPYFKIGDDIYTEKELSKKVKFPCDYFYQSGIERVEECEDGIRINKKVPMEDDRLFFVDFSDFVYYMEGPCGEDTVRIEKVMVLDKGSKGYEPSHSNSSDKKEKILINPYFFDITEYNTKQEKPKNIEDIDICYEEMER